VHHEADSDKWIFFCHGFGSDKEGSYEARAERAVEEGFNAVRFDFRGNGESDGDFRDQYLSDRIEDLKAVIDYFRPEKVYLFGTSFGGRVVFETARERDVEALIGKSPVTYNGIMSKFREAVENKGEFEVFDDKYITGEFFKDLETYSFESTLEELELPILVFHGSQDATVHFENTGKALNAYSGDIVVQKMEGEKHSFSSAGEQEMRNLMFYWLGNMI
ncbi:MAG: alpha/beta hydrolase family protein, partial [Candidatus Nanohaloarchaea archaeon]